MIYEIRTYRVKAGSVAEVEKRFGEAYESRKKHSELFGFFHTEIGTLNEIVHIWPYPSLEERARVRAGASKEANWPPKVQEFITAMRSEIVVPFPGVPETMPGPIGPVFEHRYYTVRAGTMPSIQERWKGALPERVKLSPLALVGSVEFGTANAYVHIWAYKSLAHRTEIRDRARQTGVWPPPGGGDSIVTQDNKILLPAAFSPMQ